MSEAAAESGAATPAWKSFSAERLADIESARAMVRAQGPLVRDAKGTYGLICRACTKPNSVDVDFCTGCGFPSQPEDVQRLPDNIFKELVDGKDIGAVVRYRDDDNIVVSCGGGGATIRAPSCHCHWLELCPLKLAR